MPTTKCVKQNTKNILLSKENHPHPANECCGEIYEGNDGNTYESVADKKGICKWKKNIIKTEKRTYQRYKKKK